MFAKKQLPPSAVLDAAKSNVFEWRRLSCLVKKKWELLAESVVDRNLSFWTLDSQQTLAALPASSELCSI